MKKYIITISIIVVLVVAADFAYYRLSVFGPFKATEEVTSFVKTDEENIYIDTGQGFEKKEIRGVNLGSGIPGHWSMDFAIDKDTYLRWFREIQDMGANTVRVYTVQEDTFYKAFFEYNEGNSNPLWLIQGVWVNDYTQNSHRDAYDEDFFKIFKEDCETMVDVIHGKKKISLGRMASSGSGSYNKDVSSWVIGYIIGVDWNPSTVSYTDEKYSEDKEMRGYQGKYLRTSYGATAFETMLAKTGDSLIDYESKKYANQRMVAFSNYAFTDPFVYSKEITDYYEKCTCIDAENIVSTKSFLSGMFASYHVDPYYPDFVKYEADSNKENTYRQYLDRLVSHHKSMPVMISEFGIPSSRGVLQGRTSTTDAQGGISEKEQGETIVACYEDIISSGCVGGCVASWQDEWYKKVWNTMYLVDSNRTPYWSDYQTASQGYGLLSFDPGENSSICYVDGEVSEWTESDVIAKNGNMELSVKYDAKFMYFLVHKKQLDFSTEALCIPLDVTPDSGSVFCKNTGNKFDRAADFVMIINGRDNTRLMVQERYEALRSTYSQEAYGFDTYEKGKNPEINSPLFVNINGLPERYKIYETGKLIYGNSNPNSKEFNSLADFNCNGDYIEIRIPWQLMNFSDPSKMKIHGDYYSGNYGVENKNIKCIYAGVGNAGEESRLKMERIGLKGWKNNVEYHERLKSSYYILKDYWSIRN